MAKSVFNFSDHQDLITFNIGSHSFDYSPSDDKEQALSQKADELKEKSAEFEVTGDEWGLRQQIKVLLDEFFALLFNEDAPTAIYQACGQNTVSYFRLFFKIIDHIHKVNQQRLNDETFKKYLAE